MRMAVHASPLSTVSLMLLGGAAHSQTAGNISFTANQTSATGRVVPVLTWSTTPVASGCVARGGWGGNRFASGSETLPAITVSTSYSLTCTWRNGAATVNWTPPTANTDGSPLRDLAGFRVVYGTSANALTQSRQIDDPAARSATIAALQTGTWYFAVRALNRAQLESDNSIVVSRSITEASASRNLSITINAAPAPSPTPRPPPPSPSPSPSPPSPAPTPSPNLRTISRTAWDVQVRNGTTELGRLVGIVDLGIPCNGSYRIGSDHYAVEKKRVMMITKPRSDFIVVQCGPAR
jgi:hypothetical protein